jgi:hypothetical protein
MSSLVEEAQHHVESLVADLEGDNDFMPFLTIACLDDKVVYVGLAMPGEEGKNDLADVMGALTAAYRAQEVVFASVSWMVKADSREGLGHRMPSEHPDRVEAVFLLHVTGDMNDIMHSAEVRRTNGRVTLGAWDSFDATEVAGRFGEAIHRGMVLSANLPPEMVAYIEANFAAGNDEEVIGPLIRAFHTLRTGDFPTHSSTQNGD